MVSQILALKGAWQQKLCVQCFAARLSDWLERCERSEYRDNHHTLMTFCNVHTYVCTIPELRVQKVANESAKKPFPIKIHLF
jgi:hypothetical protein